MSRGLKSGGLMSGGLMSGGLKFVHHTLYISGVVTNKLQYNNDKGMWLLNKFVDN